jgi:hypothetical protein
MARANTVVYGGDGSGREQLRRYGLQFPIARILRDPWR